MEDSNGLSAHDWVATRLRDAADRALSATAINVRGNMKRELREKFPDMAADELEALAERLAVIARVYALAMRAA